MVDNTISLLKGYIRNKYKQAGGRKSDMLKKKWFQEGIRVPLQLVRQEDRVGEATGTSEAEDAVATGFIPEESPPNVAVEVEIPSQTPLLRTPVKKLKTSSSKRGRPALPSPLKGRSAMYDHLKKVRESHRERTLLTASQQKLKRSGKNTHAKILKLFDSSPNQPKKLSDLIDHGKKTMIQQPFTPEEALALLLELSLSDRQYRILRQSCINKGYKKIFPSIGSVRTEKIRCRPPAEEITVTGSSAEVSLQSLLTHTTSRLVDCTKEVFIAFAEKTHQRIVKATLLCCWGMDGSSGQARYKQKCSDGSRMFDDSSVFASVISPLQISNDLFEFWLNPRPQSSSFCRILKLQYRKEDKELMYEERARVKAEILNLVPFRVRLTDKLEVEISFNIHLTAIDGKILTTIAGSSGAMANCPLCDATPNQMNMLLNIDNGVFSIKESRWQYGISPLHARIRFLECILHISYRLPFNQWRRNKEQMLISKARQKKIQGWLIEAMGLRVDFPCQGGSGTSNDGNTSRRAFENFPLFASITGVKEELIENFYYILTAINCGKPLDHPKFAALCRSTAELYVQNYPWYPMPSSVHKVLIHGAEIAQHFSLPLAFYGEEAGESCNKEYRKIRLEHTRKADRKLTMRDLVNRKLETSDPKLAMNRVGVKMFQRKRASLPHAVVQLFALPPVPEVIRRLNFDDQIEDEDIEIADFEEIDVTLDGEFQPDTDFIMVEELKDQSDDEPPDLMEVEDSGGPDHILS